MSDTNSLSITERIFVVVPTSIWSTRIEKVSTRPFSVMITDNELASMRVSVLPAVAFS